MKRHTALQFEGHPLPTGGVAKTDQGDQTTLVTVQQLPIIRSSSGTILTDTQTHKNVRPKRYYTTREVVKAPAAPTPLELEEQSHAASRAAADQLIRKLRAQNNLLETQLQAAQDHVEKSGQKFAQATNRIAELEVANAKLERDWNDLLEQVVDAAETPDGPLPENERQELKLRAQRFLVMLAETDKEASERIAECVELRAELAKARKQIAELQSRPDEASLVKGVHDDLTHAYLREWFKRLSPDEKAQQDLLIHELCKPWHERGPAWHGIVRRCEDAHIGKTPYEMSPPKNVVKGQGAVQPGKAAA